MAQKMAKVQQCPACGANCKITWCHYKGYAERQCLECKFKWKDEAATQRAEKFLEELREKEEQG